MHPEKFERACESGADVDRGKHRFLSPEKHRRIRDLLLKKWTPAAIAEDVGRGVVTVYRARKALERDAA